MRSSNFPSAHPISKSKSLLNRSWAGKEEVKLDSQIDYFVKAVWNAFAPPCAGRQCRRVRCPLYFPLRGPIAPEPI